MLIVVLAVGAASASTLFLMGQPRECIAFGVSLGVGAALAGGCTASWTIGFGQSIVAAILAGTLVGIGYGVAGTDSIKIIFASNLPGAISLLAGAGFAAGAIANVAMFPDQSVRHTFLGQIAVCIIAFAVAFAMFGGLFLLNTGFFKEGIGSPFFAFAWAIPTSLALGPVLTWKTKAPVRSWFFSLTVLLVSCGLIFVTLVIDAESRSPMSQALRGFCVGAVDALLIAAMFAFPFTVARAFGSAAAAGAASAISVAAVLLIFSIYVVGLEPRVMIGTATLFVVLGLLFPIVRAILFIPFWSVWNTFLVYQDASNDSALLLKWNSCFLDELQFGKQAGIVEHLALALQCDPEIAKSAEADLLEGRQSWAVAAAYDERLMQNLEACENIKDVASTSHASATNEFLDGLQGVARDIQVALRQNSSFRRRLTLETVDKNLSALHRSLAGNRRMRQRLSDLCSQWRVFLSEQIAVENEAVAKRREILNPYVATPILEEATTFVGREDVAARIERLILDERRQPLFLLGQRRIGKTSLLNNFGRLLPSSIIPMYVDLQGSINKSTDQAQFLYFLASSLSDSLKRLRSIDHPAPSWDEMKEGGFVTYDAWFSDLETRFADCSFLLQLDEAEALLELPDERLQSVIFQHLRHVIQHRKRVRVLLASSHHLDELAGWSKFLVNVRLIELGYLDRISARELIERPVSGFDLSYSTAAVEALCSLTSCHPALLQLMCSTIIERRNECHDPDRSAITPTEVDAAVPQAIEEGAALYFMDIATVAGEAGRQVLQYVAKQADCTVVSIQSALPEVDVASELTKLRRRRVITRDEPVKFEVELVRKRFVSQNCT